MREVVIRNSQSVTVRICSRGVPKVLGAAPTVVLSDTESLSAVRSDYQKSWVVTKEIGREEQKWS